MKLPSAPKQGYEAVQRAWLTDFGGGQYGVTLPSLRIHAAVVFEQNTWRDLPHIGRLSY